MARPLRGPEPRDRKHEFEETAETMSKSTDIRICEVQTQRQQIDYRTPIKFGGRVVRDVTVVDAKVLDGECLGVAQSLAGCNGNAVVHAGVCGGTEGTGEWH